MRTRDRQSSVQSKAGSDERSFSLGAFQTTHPQRSFRYESDPLLERFHRFSAVHSEGSTPRCRGFDMKRVLDPGPVVIHIDSARLRLKKGESSRTYH